MRALAAVLLAVTCFAQTNSPLDRARQFEKEGDAVAARNLLRSAAQNSSDPALLLGYAEFLDRHRDPAARDAYRAALERIGGDAGKAERVARRLVVLDLLAADQKSLEQDQARYARVAGRPLNLGVARPEAEQPQVIAIPGPLRSFARMAALAPDLRSEDVLPALARNIVTNGYQASSSAEGLEPTEYLKLVIRYLSQAREIEKLAGPNKVLKIEACDSAQTADLLRVLGYRMRGGCGSEVVLETVNATRAFLTIDSGFPLAELEQALRANRPFEYDYKPSQIPVLYGADYWLSGIKDRSGDFVDEFIGDPSLCRLYLGFSRLDDETSSELRKAVQAQRLKAFAHVLDFYGGMFEIRNGKAVVPGGPQAANAWAQIAGKSPDEGAAFFERLLTRDDGWLASYYDALARMNGRGRDYLLDPKRLQRIYTAIRGKVTSPGPARPVFRANTDMLLLTQRLRIEADGTPHIPGGLEVWKTIIAKHPHSKYEGKNTRPPASWKEPDDLMEALFAMTRRTVENEPLRLYMVLTDLNRSRAKPLDPATVERLAKDYRPFSAQYSIFNEVPTLSDKSIIAYLDAAQAISRVRDNLLRANMAGSLQGLAGVWQMLCRQRAIDAADADATFAAIVEPFVTAREAADVFDAARGGIEKLLKASHSPADISPQDRMLDLLAGTRAPSDPESHQQMLQDMMQLFEAQKLISLKSIFDVADHIAALSKGEKLNPSLVNRFASRVGEIQMPRASLSSIEKNTLTFGYWTEKHIEAQRKINIRAALERAGTDAEKLAETRALLLPFLRDTIVGLNYIHYAPPGAQVLLTNPLFVRMHDFIGMTAANQTWRSTEIYGTGWPSNAGGRLVGSLVSLPYALAEAEQNFLIPTREQALIWGDLVPQMLISAKVPRWWSVTPSQIKWVSLHMNLGESLLAEAALDAKQRAQALEMLSAHAPPARIRRVEDLLAHGQVRDAVEQTTPSELFLLAQSWLQAHPEAADPLSSELRTLKSEHSAQVTAEAISHAFGTPKPTLAHSYAPELMNLRTFPTLMGYSSRIMAESWESNNLFYAALADELHLRPSQLNIMVPQWTQQTVENIFATHLEDWPALLRSLRLVGDQARTRMRAAAGADRTASLN